MLTTTEGRNEMNNSIKKQLTSLGVGDLANIIESLERDLSLSDLSYDEKINMILNELITQRKNALIERLKKNAELKYPSASLASLDCESRGLNDDKIRNIAMMTFIDDATNIIITGPTGAGKTYLACVLGNESCKHMLRTHYIRMPDIIRHIQSHKDNLKEVVRYRKRLGNYKLLIIDEWLNYKVNEKESKFLYELIEQRGGTNSTIFVGQYAISDWHERLGGGTVAESILDRIIHNSYEIPTNDMNMREIYDGKKVKKFIEENDL